MSPTDRRTHGETLRLFEGCGIELEYALVDRASLDVAPIADRVLQEASQSDRPVNEYVRGELAWSNELALHVLEVKNVRPTSGLEALRDRLQDEVLAIDRVLARHGARLMPGGMHPWMDPARETQLWPHGDAPIYQAYDRLFDCRRHGWANLQSTHLNLPFADDRELARLHAAIRVVLPLLPALAAASPYADGRASGILDYRMEAYRRNAESVPQLNGAIVPDPVMSEAEYRRTVLEPLYQALRALDPQSVLEHEWLNARGAIVRFDRRALEIRVLDTQECPAVDVAWAALVSDLAQSLCERQFHAPTARAQLPTSMLGEIFVACTHEADRAHIRSPEYLEIFGVRRSCRAGELWSAIGERLDRERTRYAALWRSALEFVTVRGTLARRLLRAVGPRPNRAALHELYTALCDAMHTGKPFDP